MDTSPIALYYPHTRIQSEALLKTALLLWDQIECIIPNGLVAPQVAQDSYVREAEEIVVRQRIPTSAEKHRVHSRVQRLLESGVPPWVYEQFKDPDQRFYLIYPDKLSHETWRLLEGVQLAELVGSGGRDYQVPPALGLLLMSMLADECASATRTRVTDRTHAYSWLMGLMTHDLGGDFLPNLDATHLASTYDRLITVSIQTVNTDGIPLQDLVDLRRREAAGSSTDYRKLRKRYAERTSVYVHRLGDPKLNVADQCEIQRQYTLDMESDLRELKRELGIAAAKALLSKEVGTVVLAVAGAILVPSAMPAFNVLGVGALVKTGVDYIEARRKALEGHVLSWLYLAR